MKRPIVIALIIGIIIGVGQIFFIYNKTLVPSAKIGSPPSSGGELTGSCQLMSAECTGVCTGKTVGDTCYYDPYQEKFRGFPFSNTGTGKNGIIAINFKIYLNTAIWIPGLPLLTYSVLKLTRK